MTRISYLTVWRFVLTVFVAEVDTLGFGLDDFVVVFRVLGEAACNWLHNLVVRQRAGYNGSRSSNIPVHVAGWRDDYDLEVLGLGQGAFEQLVGYTQAQP